MTDRAVCAACSRAIDAAAKLCPYCGAVPATGERMDTQSLLEEIFRPKTLTTSESVLDYARQRQGIVIAVSIFVAFLILAALHQYVTVRNNTAVTNATAVPLTEITDVTKKDETAQIPMPELDFQYHGRAQTMRTYVIEPGAIPPPEVVAAQQPAQPQSATPGGTPQPARPATAQPPAASPRPAPAPAQRPSLR